MKTVVNVATSAGDSEIQAKYVVLDENTLCYRIPGMSTMLGVLAGSVIRGGHNPINGPVSILPGANMREATLKDFDFFRVCPIGHIA
jgi:hypothetical protein